MVRKKGFIIAAVMAVISMVHPTSVYADGGGTILIESKEVKAGETRIQTSCIVSGDVYATNGKLRITYDPQQMVLKEADAGEALGDSTVQINDPVIRKRAKLYLFLPQHRVLSWKEVCWIWYSVVVVAFRQEMMPESR